MLHLAAQAAAAVGADVNSAAPAAGPTLQGDANRVVSLARAFFGHANAFMAPGADWPPLDHTVGTTVRAWLSSVCEGAEGLEAALLALTPEALLSLSPADAGRLIAEHRGPATCGPVLPAAAHLPHPLAPIPLLSPSLETPAAMLPPLRFAAALVREGKTLDAAEGWRFGSPAPSS